nr:putative ribonuclease H-like domain-containing protein [Tanacetum cinerariifolium]
MNAKNFYTSFKHFTDGRLSTTFALSGHTFNPLALTLYPRNIPSSTPKVTTEDMQKRRNDVKARKTLLLALPDEHQLRFSKYKTSQELWAAILKTFGGNEATKKTKKNQRNRSDLDTMSLDDLYNHLKVYEPEVQKKSESNSYNMAFISLAKNNNGKEEVNTASFSTASTQVSSTSADVATASFSHDTICAYIASQSNGSQKKTRKKLTIQGTDVAGFDKSRVECFNCHKMGHFTRECRAPRIQDRGRRENFKQGSKEEEHALKALMAIDEVGWDWSYMANEEESHALVEMRLVEFKNQEIYEKIRGLEFKVESKDNRIERLTKELEELKKEKEGLDSKLTVLLETVLGDILLWGNSQNVINDKGFWDSGCSRHMTGNIFYLSNYDPYDGGYVSFGQGGGKITFDETSGILRNFVTEIENIKELMVKIIRCDNGGEFKNKEMNDLSSRKVVVAGTTSTNFSGTKDFASQDVKKDVSSLRYIALPNWFHEAHLESSISNAQVACNANAPESTRNSNPIATSTNPPVDHIETLKVESPIPTISSLVPTAYLVDSLEPSIYQMDVKSAFIYGIINEEIYVMQPPDFKIHSFQQEFKRIFRYLKGHLKLGIWYPKDFAFDLVAYSDSDYGGATQNRKLTTRGCQFLGRRLISWQCKKQTIVATSTTEAEYVAAASGCGQVL